MKQLTQVHLKRWPLCICVCVCVACCIDLHCEVLIGADAMCVTGTFGRVYFATLLTYEADAAVHRPVLVKTVTGKWCLCCWLYSTNTDCIVLRITVLNNNNSSNTTKINYLNWRFDLNQRPSSEEAGTQFFRFLTRVNDAVPICSPISHSFAQLCVCVCVYFSLWYY